MSFLPPFTPSTSFTIIMKIDLSNSLYEAQFSTAQSTRHSAFAFGAIRDHHKSFIQTNYTQTCGFYVRLDRIFHLPLSVYRIFFIPSIFSVDRILYCCCVLFLLSHFRLIHIRSNHLTNGVEPFGVFFCWCSWINLLLFGLLANKQ